MTSKVSRLWTYFNYDFYDRDELGRPQIRELYVSSVHPRMTCDTDGALRVAGKPQLLHAVSEQSITASDHYYSLSEHASEGSSVGSLLTVVRYETPPSQSRSPVPISDKVQLEALVSLKVQDVPSTEVIEAPKVVESEEDGPDEGKLDESTNAIVTVPTDNDLGAPTPGVDDAPYIRFAIDQLTRDEELTGRRRSVSGNSEASYPVERIVPDEGLGYYRREGSSPPRRKQSLDRPVERHQWPGQ